MQLPDALLTDPVRYCWHLHIRARDGQIPRLPSACRGKYPDMESCVHVHTVLQESYLRFLCFQIPPEQEYRLLYEVSDPDFSHSVLQNRSRWSQPLLYRKYHHVSELLPHLNKHHEAVYIFLPLQYLQRFPDFWGHWPSESTHLSPVCGFQVLRIPVLHLPVSHVPWQAVLHTDIPHPDSAVHGWPVRCRTKRSFLWFHQSTDVRFCIPVHPAVFPFPAVP